MTGDWGLDGAGDWPGVVWGDSVVSFLLNTEDAMEPRYFEDARFFGSGGGPPAPSGDVTSPLVVAGGVSSKPLPL